MQILILGAGATGGYFGGRLMQSGRDVTFLVRKKRATELAGRGLVIRSTFGDAEFDNPKTVTAATLVATFDLILLSCKAYDLDSSIDSIAPAVGPDTLILPLLNGMRHMDVLDDRFGPSKVLGGRCVIAATLDDARNVMHLNDMHSITFGAREPQQSSRIAGVTEALGNAGFDAIPSENIVQEMWEKWVVLATLAGMTCLMRASVGQIVSAPRGADLILALYAECADIAADAGFEPRPEFKERTLGLMTDPESTLTASMMRDLEAGNRIEGDHIVGDLLARRGDGDGLSLLEIAYAHLKAYENRFGVRSS